MSLSEEEREIYKKKLNFLKNEKHRIANTMAVVTSKTGNKTESFNVFKQKVGKQTSSFRGFKQHFTSSTINQDNQQPTAVFKEEVRVEEARGFVPSDVLNDPGKREFLTQLSKRMWMEKEKFLSKCRVLAYSYVYTVIYPKPNTSYSDFHIHTHTYGPIILLLTCF